ncbi:hypothetical protein [Azospirillum doebereinerae]|uniref:hypothetical protein n=1 Tax=Azospirillum doebereinerae TaxID=92933 RepID=UPI00163BB245|nr:hypothetical protein [Azospirillum doebereinerae]
MPDNRAEALTSVAPSPALTIPEALASEATAMLLGGNVDGIKAVQEKLAHALAGQGVSGDAAGTLADGWVRSFAEGVGAASSPDAAIAEAGRQMTGTAARMAQAMQDAAGLTTEQRVAAALAQGQDPSQSLGSDAAPGLSKALFAGVMDQMARPAGAADPVAALSRALTETPEVVPTAAPVALSPAEKLTSALASGVAVSDAVKAAGAESSGVFAQSLERALSSGGDVTASIATAAEQAAHGVTQTQAVAVEQSGGERLLTALAAGGAEAARTLGGVEKGAAFAGVLGDALARGAAPDAALDRSVKAQSDTAAMVNGAEVAPKPTDALVASLASGRNVAETVKSFAAAAGVDPSSAGGFGKALGAALSSGTDAVGALGTAQQDASAATSMMVASAQGVKGDPLSTALASGQNVQQSLQAVGGTGVFGNALAQALSEGRSMGQALASARQAADMAQQNSQDAAVAVSAENKAMADLATPKAEVAADQGKADPQVAEHVDPKSDAKTEAPAEGKEAAKAEPEAEGEKTAEGDAKDAGKGEAKADAKTAAADKADAKADAKAESGEPAAKDVSPSADKPFGMDSAALKATGFTAPDSAVKASPSADSSSQSASSGATLASTAPVTKTTSSTDAFATVAAVQQSIKSAERIIEAIKTDPLVVTPTPVPPEPVHLRAPVLAPDYDAAALAKALAITESTAAPAGFTVFHLIETMFRAGETGSSVIGVAVVGNPGSALGVWQYSVDGSTWLEIGTVGDGAALVLAGSAMLRFLASEGASGTAPSLSLRAVNDSWTEGFTGAGKTLFALTGTGGTSALSAEVGSLALLVTPVNDAPVATGTTVVLDSIVEDTADPAGATVSSLFAALFSDPKDAVNGLSGDQFAGVVVVGDESTAAQGVWQYWNGSAWAAVGAVSEGSGLLLAADAKLRFLPAADWHGTTPTLTVRLVEDSSGAVTTGSHADLSAGAGLTTRYSAETIALTQIVTPVNDAPVATGTSASLAPTLEDTTDPAGATVSSLFAALFSDAKDAVNGSSGNAIAGVAIVGDGSSSAMGVWQYWNGSAWTAVGAVSEGSALIVTAGDKLRFVPSPDWHSEVPALTVRLIDSSAGAIASGGRVDLGSLGVGGITPYSAETITLTTSVTAVNDAPVSSGTAVTLATIMEDTANPAGATVSSLFAALFSDPKDAVNGASGDQFAGVVVVGDAATAGQGAWQYWNGSAWTAVGAVSEGSGLLLAADAKLRFLPAADWNGTTPALTVRLVDNSAGALSTGNHADLSSGAGLTTRYSAEAIALTQTVTAVNDAPVALGTTATLSAIAEDTANPVGQTVASVFAALFSDAKDAVSGGSSANAFAGIAIVGNAATAQGVWQYWNGSAWTAVGAVSESSALLVKATDQLRFVPAADWNGTAPALTVRLIDGSGGTVATGGHADLTATGVGGDTAYSGTTVELSETVTPVNDAPHVTAATAALSTVKGIAVAVTGLSVSDIDAGTTPLLVTLTVGHGTLTLDGGGLDAVITGNGTDSVTVRATLGTINTLLAATNGLLYTSSSSFTGTDSLSVLVDDQGGGGAGGALTATGSVTLTVIPPNASPVLIDTNLEVSTAGEASATPTGATGILVSALVGLNGSGAANVTDSDSGALTGIALVGANESYGHWWYSTDNGAHWSLVGTVNDSDSALLLRSTDRLYFQPNASVPATVSNALTIHAWDQTTGTAGTKVAVDTTTGSAFSSATDSVTLHPGVLVPNGSFDNGLTGWTYTGGSTVGTGGDGHEGKITSEAGKTVTEMEDFLGLAHGSIASATGTTPFAGHAMKMSSTVTVTQDTTLTFHWNFTFIDSGSYQDFGFVSVNGVVTLLAKAASASGTFSVTIPANTTISLGFGASDTGDNSVNPTLTVDNIKLTTVASDPIVLDMTGEGLSLRPLSDNVHFDVTGDGLADQTGWVGAGNALLARDTNHDGSISSASELVSEKFGAGFNSSLEALTSLDTNHDGRIDAQDSDYATLLVWRDNGDGVSQAGELQTLAQAGIQSIAATATASDATMAGNRILGTTSMTMADGTTHAVAGVAFDVKAAVNTVVTTVNTITAGATAVPAAQSQPVVAAAQDGTDFAAMLTSGLGLPQGLPQPASFAHDPALGGHGAEWMPDPLDPNTGHTQPHDASVHPAAHA